MSVALPVVAVLALAGFAVVVTVLSTVAARHPDRAAMLLVVAVAGGAVGLVGFVLLNVGVAGMEGALDATAVRRAGPSPVHPARAVVGLPVAAVLVGVALWVVRTTDWSRPDREDGAA